MERKYLKGHSSLEPSKVATKWFKQGHQRIVTYSGSIEHFALFVVVVTKIQYMKGSDS